jgi:diguanylate cyclase (GGDEF)-like protein/PAS domain S-box-containing protein
MHVPPTGDTFTFYESQRQLARLIDSLPGIVFSAANDSEWSMTYLSAGCFKLTGYRSAELVGAQRIITYNEVTHADDLPTVLKSIGQAIAQKQPYVIEYRITTKSGEEKWLWEKGYGVFDSNGHVLGVEGFITDITDRKQAEKALQDKEAFLRLVLDNVPQGIFWKDRNLIYRGGNRIWAQELGGKSPAELIGKTDYDLWTPEQADRYRLEDLSVIERDMSALHLIRHKVLADGQVLWQDVNKVPIHDAEGQVIGVLGAFMDVTERQWSETLLAGQKQILEMIATGASLPDTLSVLVQTIEDAQPIGIVGSILLLDPDETCLRHVATPSLPDEYALAVDGEAIGPLSGSCGAAAYYGKSVIVSDIAENYLWKQVKYRGWALAHGLKACWASPMFSSEGKVVGTFAMYCREVCAPKEQDWQLMTMATQLAGIAIERKRAEEALRQAEEKYRSIFENAVEGIFQSTPEGQYRIVNPMLARIYGYDSPAELIDTLTDIEHQLYVDPARRVEFIRLMQEQGAVWGFESQVYRRDGSTIWISECARALYNAQKELVGYEGTVENITHRKQAEVELHRRDALLRGVAEATSCLLTHSNLDAAIPKVLAILGTASKADRVYLYATHPHPETGEPAMSIQFEWVQHGILPTIDQPYWHNQPYSASGMTRWYQAFSQERSVGGITREFPPIEQEILKRDSVLAILMVPIFVDMQFWGFIGFDACQVERRWSDREESILVAIAASIGAAIKRQQTEEQMWYQAFHDVLTGLPNRTLFNHQLPQAIDHAHHFGETLAVMFLDLDRFKTINDSLGHAVGDRLLKQATTRLTMCLREGDLIARWGGDEFTVLLPNIKSADDAAKIAQRILSDLKPPFHLDGHELHITSSIGIALYPKNGQDAQTLLKNADAALYRVKEQGRNNYQFYNATINSQASELLTLDSRLYQALERNEFVLHYQPQINIITGEVTQMEALLRWQHPQLGLVPPKTFIALAEENGLIVPIGEWVLQTACAQNKVWYETGLGPVRVAVNLSARQLQQSNLVERVAQILRESEMPPGSLELEITETAVMQDVDFTTAVLQELRTMGVRIAMDDFGTGYSSLSYLKKFPLHALKIDQSFVRDLTNNPDDIAIITAIITLAQGLDLNVVAEGVETYEQMQTLRSLQCSEMQGYWFSRPLDTQAATEFLQNQRLTHSLYHLPLDRYL